MNRIVAFLTALFLVTTLAYGQEEVNAVKHTHAQYDESSKNARWVQFDGFSQTMSFEFRRFTNFLIDNGAETLELQLSNGGGSLYPALSMMDDVRMLQHNGVSVITRATGLCASACAMLWSQGDIRIVGHNSWLMFHSLALTLGANQRYTLHELEEQAVLMRRIQDEINTNLALRLNLPPEVIVDIMSRDTFITAQQALDWGLASTIE